ncbi:MAG TPA: hypothetical protein VEJ39_08925 [Candidatus Acidoferrales bacterium]|nr:hypothetical protein [Candidatus Acidoferrales bacterium]
MRRIVFVLILGLCVGTQARGQSTPNCKPIAPLEGGLGDIFSREHATSVVDVHLAFGVQFDVGKSRK